VEDRLLGHLLKANDPTTDEEVERLLASDPAAAEDLARLRAAFAPLEHDRDEIEPPTDLWARTLARVAEHMVAVEGPQARADDARTDELIRRAAAVAAPAVPAAVPVTPAPVVRQAGPPPMRRRNVVGTLGLSVAVLALVFPAGVHLRARAQRVGCQDTMRQFYEAAAGYSDANEGRFPQVNDGQPAATAVETLKLAGYLTDNTRLSCPARADAPAPTALTHYAYSLGFRDQNGELHGPDRQAGTDYLPILADAPRRQLRQAVPINHSHGQNVLYAGGNVRFCTTVRAGPNEDDIFCNAHGRIGAGVHRWDSALGRSEELP
jgi:hypothetical protein